VISHCCSALLHNFAYAAPVPLAGTVKEALAWIGGSVELEIPVVLELKEVEVGGRDEVMEEIVDVFCPLLPWTVGTLELASKELDSSESSTAAAAEVVLGKTKMKSTVSSHESSYAQRCTQTRECVQTFPPE